jgi:hypothetical protein
MAIYNRKQTKQDLGDNLFRYKVRYETEECEPYSLTGSACQKQLLETISGTPELFYCGKGRFQELRMYHDGLRWIIDLQRDEEET